LTSPRLNALLCDNEHFWKQKVHYEYNWFISNYIGSWKELYFSANSVYTFGSNLYGAVGPGDTYKPHPDLIRNIQAKQVSVGTHHSLILDMKGQVYFMGTVNPRVNRQYEGTDPKLMEGITAKSIASGGSHSLILDLNGDVYAFGRNTFGQLGVGDRNNRLNLTRVPINNAVYISAGESHSLIITNNGDVYAFGSNQYGQLGLGNRENRLLPTVIPNIKARSASAGKTYSLLIGLNAEVYAFGMGHAGQLGLGDLNDRLTPTLIPNIKAQQVSSSMYHSLLIDLNNNVYAFGSNQYGELGLGDQVGRLIPTLIPNIKARQVSAGVFYSFVVGLKGEVYGFGGNIEHQLESVEGVGEPYGTKLLLPTRTSQIYTTPSIIPGALALAISTETSHTLLIGSMVPRDELLSANPEIDRQTLMNLEGEKLIRACYANYYTEQLCDEKFWKAKLERDFGPVLLEYNTSWRELYIKKVENMRYIVNLVDLFPSAEEIGPAYPIEVKPLSLTEFIDYY